MSIIYPELNNFRLAKYKFVIESIDELVLPRYKGSAIRGGFGHAFRHAVCVARNRECPDCIIREQCSYIYVFETPTPEGTELLSGISNAPHPFVLEPPLEEKRIYPPSDKLSFDIILIGKGIEMLPFFIYAFDELGKRGLGKYRGKFNLSSVYIKQNNSERLVYSYENKRLMRDEAFINFKDILNKTPKKVNNITVSFITPTRIKHDGNLTSNIDFRIVIQNLMHRIFNLAYFHCGIKPNVRFDELLEKAKDVIITENNINWLDVNRYSARQEQILKIGGFVGEMRFSGNLDVFMPYLILAEHIHIGKGTAFGLGKIAVNIH